MPNIFKYYSLTDFLKVIHEDRSYTLKRLSESVGITPQGVGVVFNGNERMVINHLNGWKRAFNFKRLESAYFELLAILAAYASLTERNRLRERAFDLVLKLIEAEIADPAPNEMIYWISPECTILRNMIDFHDFPSEEEAIPKWAGNRLAQFRILRGHSQKEFEYRLRKAWNWLVQWEIVAFSEKRRRWEKMEPVLLSPGKINAETRNFHSSILKLSHSDFHMDFARQLGTSAILANKVATFSMPSVLFEPTCKIIDALVTRYVKNLNRATNINEMERVKAADPEKYMELQEFLKEAERLCGDLPQFTDDQFDHLVQVVVGFRKISD